MFQVVHGDAASLTHGGNRVNIVETVTVVSEQLLKGYNLYISIITTIVFKMPV